MNGKGPSISYNIPGIQEMKRRAAVGEDGLLVVFWLLLMLCKCLARKRRQAR
jgi:hypothetical protein